MNIQSLSKEVARLGVLADGLAAPQTFLVRPRMVPPGGPKLRVIFADEMERLGRSSVLPATSAPPHVSRPNPNRRHPMPQPERPCDSSRTKTNARR